MDKIVIKLQFERQTKGTVVYATMINDRIMKYYFSKTHFPNNEFPEKLKMVLVPPRKKEEVDLEKKED